MCALIILGWVAIMLYSLIVGGHPAVGIVIATFLGLCAMAARRPKR